LIPVGFGDGDGDGDEFFMRGWVWDSETRPRPAPLPSLITMVVHEKKLFNQLKNRSFICIYILSNFYYKNHIEIN